MNGRLFLRYKADFNAEIESLLGKRRGPMEFALVLGHFRRQSCNPIPRGPEKGVLSRRFTRPRPKGEFPDNGSAGPLHRNLFSRFDAPK